MDYHTLTRWAFVAYWISIITLVAVIIPGIGSWRYGARRWIDLGAFQFQPSEFAKLAFILAQAHFLSRPKDELRQADVFWKSIGLLLLPFLLIMKEPDLGSALVLLPTGLAMQYAAGTPGRYLIQLLSVVGLLAALFVADILYAPPATGSKCRNTSCAGCWCYFGRDYAAMAAPQRAGRASGKSCARSNSTTRTTCGRR